jgi:hypothetical protein
MTRNLARRVTLAFAALALVVPSTASADLVFSNLGPGNTFNTAAANPVGFDFFSGDQDAQADSFLPLINSFLTSLTIPLSSFVQTNTAPVTVALRSSIGGLPGGVLESWIIAPGTLPTFGGSVGLTQLTSVLHPAMATGTQYWVTVFGGAADPVAWNLTNTADANPTATSVNGGATWNKLGLTPGALRLDGTVAPEPTSLVLTATALVGLVSFTRRRKKVGRTSARADE